MGEFRFRIPEFWELETRHARTVHVVGIEGIPRPSSVNRVDDLLIVKRNQNESGKTYIAYPFTRRGELTICTGTLPESDSVYDLVVELARGTINRLRNQTSIWEEGGLAIPERVRVLTRQATSKLGRAITGRNEQRHESAREALEFAIEAIFALSEQFGKDIAEFRVSENAIPTFWMATSHQQDGAIESQFDIVAVQPEIILNESNSLPSERLIVGPLLDASPLSTFSKKNEDFEAGRNRLVEQCQQLLESPLDNISLIHAACGLNGIGHKNLSYRQQIQLTSELIGMIDDSVHDVPAMISFDYPWAERIAWSVGGIHPLQIADDIMRNGARLSFIGLDVNLDYWPNGSVARDPLQWIDVIDLWSQLGLPLVICLRVPQPIVLIEPNTENLEFRTNHDENVTIAIESDQTTGDEDTVTFAGNSVRENLTDNQRLNLLKTILPMIVARPGVHGVYWRQWSDDEDSRFPDAGLVNTAGAAKPTLDVIRELRTNTLQR